MASNNHSVSHHPTFSEQEAIYHETMNNFLKNSMKNLTILLQEHKLIFKDCQRFDSGGMINSIFMIEAVEEETLECVDLVLRISNTHLYWKGISVRNEIKCIRIAEKCGITTPKILCYSDNAENSPLECEFIIQYRAEGQTMRKLWKFLSNNQKQSVIEELIVMAGRLHSIQIERKGEYHVGSLLESEKSSLGVLVGDCAPIGPFKNLKETVIGYIDFSLGQLSNIEEQAHYPHYLDLLANQSELLLNLKSNLLESHEEEDTLIYQFTHCDLNSSNIMIKSDQSLDTAKVSAILDWPQCRFTSMVFECETLAHWAVLLDELKDQHEISNMETNFKESQIRSIVIEKIVPIWERNGINITIPDEKTFSKHQFYCKLLNSLRKLYFFSTSWIRSLIDTGIYDIQLEYREEGLSGCKELSELLNFDMLI